MFDILTIVSDYFFHMITYNSQIVVDFYLAYIL